MRVILQIASGPQTGRKLLLGPHRELKVGRSEWAELACEDDIKMSRVHFKLETNAVGCSIEDLGSSNGTFVNDQQLTAPRVLREGDLILAGGTQFHISIEGGSAEEAETVQQRQMAELAALREAKKSASDLADREAVLKGEKQIGYRVRQAESGLYEFTPAEPPGSRAAAEAARLALLLQTTSPLYLLVHPLQAPAFQSDDFPVAEVVFDWLPEEVQRHRSPLLLSADDAGDLPALFEKVWGQNALVVFLVTAEMSDFLVQLREAIRPAGSDALLGLCWPNVLNGLLTGSEGQLFESRLADVHAVLIEEAAQQHAWKLIAEQGFADVMQGLGLEESKPARR